MADCVEAGRLPPGTVAANRYNDLEGARLLELLRSWSPVVRRQAAKALSTKEGDHVPALRKMLTSDDRYARYGGCTAL